MLFKTIYLKLCSTNFFKLIAIFMILNCHDTYYQIEKKNIIYKNNVGECYGI